MTETDQKSMLPGFLGWIDTQIGRVEAVILAVGVLLMAVNTVGNVIGRFIFQYSFFFTEEVNSIIIILITFAGIGYAARHGRHIRMSAIYDALPTRTRKIMMILITIITAMTMFALCYFSIGYIMKVAASGRVLPALQIPVYMTFLWVPVGFAVTGIQYALTTVKNILEKDVYLSTYMLEGYDDSEIEI
nr:TRAP transporter small permease [Sneathiella sp.]